MSERERERERERGYIVRGGGLTSLMASICFWTLSVNLHLMSRLMIGAGQGEGESEASYNTENEQALLDVFLLVGFCHSNFSPTFFQLLFHHLGSKFRCYQ